MLVTDRRLEDALRKCFNEGTELVFADNDTLVSVINELLTLRSLVRGAEPIVKFDGMAKAQCHARTDENEEWLTAYQAWASEAGEEGSNAERRK